jgi:hypothetical protein
MFIQTIGRYSRYSLESFKAACLQIYANFHEKYFNILKSNPFSSDPLKRKLHIVNCT